jgi:hypothetical protein
LNAIGAETIAAPGPIESIFGPHFFESAEEEIFASRRFQKLAAMVTTAGNEVKIATAMKSLQAFGHENNIVRASISPALCSAKTSSAKNGAPTAGKAVAQANAGATIK